MFAFNELIKEDAFCIGVGDNNLGEDFFVRHTNNTTKIPFHNLFPLTGVPLHLTIGFRVEDILIHIAF